MRIKGTPRESSRRGKRQDRGGRKHIVADACRRTRPDRRRRGGRDDVRIAIQSPLRSSIMADSKRAPEPSLQRERALSRWDNEGGGGFGGPQNGGSSAEGEAEIPRVDQRRTRAAAGPGHRSGESADRTARRRVRSAAGPRPRDGGLHFSETRFYPTFPDGQRSGPYGRPRTARQPVPGSAAVSVALQIDRDVRRDIAARRAPS